MEATNEAINMGELYAALALARLEFGNLTKTKTAQIKSEKGSYSYSYADLADLVEATASALAKHGLVIIQEPEVMTEGARSVVVMYGSICHKSGAVRILRTLALPAGSGDARSVGSAISYARRYQIQAALNLAADDDDGAEAGKPQPATRAAAARAAESRTAPTPPSIPANGHAPAPQSPGEEQFMSAADNPFEDADDDPAAALRAIVGTWRGPVDAQMWAVQVGACENDFEAKNSFRKIVESVSPDGKLTKGNQGAVYAAFFDRQQEKLAEKVAVTP